MINTKNIEEALKEIKKLIKEGKKVVVEAGDDNFNRKIFESKEVDMVTGLEFNKKDKLKQRNSGMNEIIAKLAKKNKIDIGIDISRINKLSPFEKTRILGRIKQNIKLSKKNDVKILVIGADSRESMSFIKILGGDTKRVKILL